MAKTFMYETDRRWVGSLTVCVLSGLNLYGAHPVLCLNPWSLAWTKSPESSERLRVRADTSFSFSTFDFCCCVADGLPPKHGQNTNTKYYLIQTKTKEQIKLSKFLIGLFEFSWRPLLFMKNVKMNGANLTI